MLTVECSVSIVWPVMQKQCGEVCVLCSRNYCFPVICKMAPLLFSSTESLNYKTYRLL